MTILREEKKYFKKGYQLIAGVDEAGRGPLAGPVVAACVSCDDNFRLANDFKKVTDSKKLTGKKRDELFDLVMNNFSGVGVGICSPEEVDKFNVFQATFVAMERAIKDINKQPEFLMIDGKFIVPQIDIKQDFYIKGDERVFLISAASIIAKVTRDRLMQEAHVEYPEYGFDRHKGYGTKLHMEQLQKHGPCEIHRKSFGPVKKLL